MAANFQDVMSKRTDDELIKIVTEEFNDYQPLAVEAAENEIKLRGLDTKKFDDYKIESNLKIEKQKQFDSRKVSSSTRFANYIIDIIASTILTMILSLVLIPLSNYQTLQEILNYLVLIIGYSGYYIFMETKYQKTIGKFITKSIVVKKDGSKPEFIDIVKRTFCRLIPFDNISFIFTPNGFHDRLSNTTLIKDLSTI